MPEILEMTTAACEALLRAGTVGQIALCTPSGPQIVPVDYTVVEDTVFLHVPPFSVLGTYGRDSVLALAVELVEPASQLGWSVVARGRSYVVTDPVLVGQVGQLGASRAPRRPGTGARSLLVGLPWSELSGRQGRSGWVPTSAQQFGSEHS